jgi:hypothetical protein
MATAAFNEKKLRGIVKSALADAFKENRELMQDHFRAVHKPKRYVQILSVSREPCAVHRLRESQLFTIPKTPCNVNSPLANN